MEIALIVVGVINVVLIVLLFSIESKLSVIKYAITDIHRILKMRDGEMLPPMPENRYFGNDGTEQFGQ